jgi:hypothetical protein
MKFIFIAPILYWLFTVTYRKHKIFLRHINLDLLCIYNSYYTYCYLIFEIYFVFTSGFVVHAAKLCEKLYKDGYSVILRTVQSKCTDLNYLI